MIDDKTIVEKTYKLYSKYGIKSISVDEIALVLGISKKTLYIHIKSRDELLRQVIEFSLTRFAAGLTQAIEKDKNVFMKLALFNVYLIRNTRKMNPAFLFDLKKVNHEQYRQVNDFRTQKLYEIFKSIIQLGIEQDLFRGDLDLKYVYFNQMHKVSENAYKVFPSYNEAVSKNTIFKLLLNDVVGLTTLKGHQEFEAISEDLLQLL